MKKKLFLLYLALIHLFLGLVLVKSDFISRVERKIGVITANSPFPVKANTKAKTSRQKVLFYHEQKDANVPDECVIFFGDSMTKGLCVSAVVPLSINFSIGGETSAGLLERFPKYKSVERAGAVVIAIGINDIPKRNNKEILKNYRMIIQKIPKKVPVVFSAVLPIDEHYGKYTQGTNQRIIRLNEKLKMLCATSPRVFYVDAGPFLTDRDGNLSDKFHYGNSSHLNSVGREIWIRELKKTIQNVQQSYVKEGGVATFNPQQ